METCNYTASSLRFSRVTSPFLEPQKKWYILNKDICGILPSKFAKSEVFKRFPDEIRTVSGREVLPAKSLNIPLFARTPSTVYTVSTFGLIAGLLRQKEVPRDGLFTSPLFKRVIDVIDSIELDLEAHEEESWEARHFHRNPAQLSSSPELVENPQMKCGNNLFTFSESEMIPPCFTSTPNCSPSVSCTSISINDTKNNPDIGSTTKKRQIVKKCRKVIASLKDVCEKHQETISCVLGKGFVFGCDAEKDEVTNIVSEIVDFVMKS